MDELDNVMTPDHERWNDFIFLLAGEGYCNFRQVESLKYTWDCSGEGHEFARKALSTFDNIDIEKSIEFFKDNGGHCDCEIAFNVQVHYTAVKAGLLVRAHNPCQHNY